MSPTSCQLLYLASLLVHYQFIAVLSRGYEQMTQEQPGQSVYLYCGSWAPRIIKIEVIRAERVIRIANIEGKPGMAAIKL